MNAEKLAIVFLRGTQSAAEPSSTSSQRLRSNCSTTRIGKLQSHQVHVCHGGRHPWTATFPAGKRDKDNILAWPTERSLRILRCHREIGDSSLLSEDHGAVYRPARDAVASGPLPQGGAHGGASGAAKKLCGVIMCVATRHGATCSTKSLFEKIRRSEE